MAAAGGSKLSAGLSKMADVVKRGFKHASPTNRQDIETMKHRVDSILHPRHPTQGRIPPPHLPLPPLDMPARGNPSHPSGQGRVPAPMTGHAAREMAGRLFDPLAGHWNKRKTITVLWWLIAALLVGYLFRIWARRRRGGGEVGGGRGPGEGEDGDEDGGGEGEEDDGDDDGGGGGNGYYILRIANLDMGEPDMIPVTSKRTDGGENVRVVYAATSMQGWPDSMEDAHTALADLDNLTSFFGVFDGHGGAEVSMYCASQFHIELFDHPDYQRNLTNAMLSAFFRVDKLLSDDWRELDPRVTSDWPFTKAIPCRVEMQTGSTACIAVIRENQTIVGNVGDSRCVLSSNGQAIDLSNDHKPNLRAERLRIEKAGGQVTRDNVVALSGGQVLCQCLGAHRVNGILAVSRVIGNFSFKKNRDLTPEEQMVTCDPELLTMEITNDIKFLVIACDGLWKCMTSQDVVDFVHQQLDSGETNLRTICEKLVDRGLPSTDNVTAILVYKFRI